MDNRQQQRQQQRGISNSKSKGSSIGNNFFSPKLCSSCVQPLGLFISRGSCCPKCGLKVCKKCKIYEVQSRTWNCLACYKISKHTRGATVNSRGDSRAVGIKRSFSTSETSRSSPVLKSYTKYNEDRADRPYNSLPRMASQFHTFVGDPKEGDWNATRGNILERKSSAFQSTLHPFRDINDKSPTSSVHFIEDEYWDYYDYEFNSNRSSCERSLGETVEYQHCVSEGPPRKPERRKSRSMGAFDAKYSQLKTYCLITKDSGKDRGSYNSLPRKPRLSSSSAEKENSIVYLPGSSSNKSDISQHSRDANSIKSNKTSSLAKDFRGNIMSPSSGLKNRTIVTLNNQDRHEPQPLLVSKSLLTTPNPPSTQERIAKSKLKTQQGLFPSNRNPCQTSANDPYANPSSSELSTHKDFSSLRKNKYQEFYNGISNKSNAGLYFSLPPMRDRDRDRELPAKKQSIERDIPIQFEQRTLPLHKSKPTTPINTDANSLENPYFILEQLKRKSQELEQQRTKSFTMPRSARSFPSTTKNTPTSSPTESSSPPTGPLHNDNNNRESACTARMTDNSIIPPRGGREVIIVIEREGDSHNPMNGSTADKLNKPSHSSHNADCNRNNSRSSKIESGAPAPTGAAAQQCDPINGDTPQHSIPPAISTSTTSTSSSSDDHKNGHLKTSDTSSNKMDGNEMEDILLSTSCSSSSSFLSNLDIGEDGPFLDCWTKPDEIEFGFKSCEDEGGDDEGGIGARQGGGVGQVRGTPASYSCASAQNNSTTTADNPPENMVTTLQPGPTTGDSSATRSTAVLLPIHVTTTGNSNINMSISSSGGGSGSRAQQQQRSASGTIPTTKKFINKILVNADNVECIDGITSVEINEDQVGIVTGSGTFIHPTSKGPEENFSLGNNGNVVCRSRGAFLRELVQDPPTTPFCNSSPGKNPNVNDNYYIFNATQGESQPDCKIDDTYNNDQSGSRKNVTIPIPHDKSCPERTDLVDVTPFDKFSESIDMGSLKGSFSCRRQSPEGEESALVKNKFDGTSDHDNSIPGLAAPTRSSPDGADKSDKSDDSSPTPVIEEPTEDDEEGESSTDSWTEETFDDDEGTEKPPLDLALHTIVEESCEESEAEEIPKPTTLNELEKYYNFSSEQPINYEESEFSDDTFSESSLRFENTVDLNHDPFELETGRLEKYFLNLGLSNESDSVGSESESECSVLDNRKKVLKHHRRSAEFDDSQDQASEDDENAFEQDGLDTIKKQRKLRRSSEDLLDQVIPPPVLLNPITIDVNTIHTAQSESSHSSSSKSSRCTNDSESSVQTKEPNPVSVSRSNSFSWSSDEEVNVMMSKLRHLIKNLVHMKKVDEQKNDKLLYLENELVRLMKNENIKNIVESISDSDEDVYKLFERVENNEPEILNKVMGHITSRLNSWMKDEEFTDDGIKSAPSISSDLNEDRFSWKGSFESSIFAAKRQSVGSSDSIDVGANPQEGNELFSDRSILRSSSLHHLATSQPILEESEPLANSLPRLNEHPVDNARPTKNALLISHQVKSGRYRPPGYETHVSTPTLSTTSFNSFSTNKLHDGKITIRGQIEFLMQYNYKCSTFELCIKQCRDLAAVDSKRGRSDPYVKVYLLPERTKASKKKTKVKKNTLNPLFSETLKFPVTLEELENRILWLTVWHSGLFGKNEFLGEVLLNLRNITFDENEYKWYPLQEQRPLENFTVDEPETKQNLVLSLALKWCPRTSHTGNLTILIKEARGLKYIKNSYPSTFIKCSPINEKSKKQKTPICRKTLNPIWNFTLNFENITDDGLELAFYNNHELIGNVKLDCDCDVWREMVLREGFWVEGVATFE